MGPAIVIAVRNQLACTQQCLKSLHAHTEPFHLVLVDNGSTDGTAEWVLDYCEAADIPCDALPYGGTNLSAAWNLGLARARRYDPLAVVVANNDVLVSPLWWRVTAEHFRDYPATWCACGDAISREMSPLFLELAAERISARAWRYSPGWIDGCLMALRTSTLDRLAIAGHSGNSGPFDERFRIWFGDTDLGRRLDAAGHPPAILQGVPLVHFGSKTTGDVPGHAAIIDEDRRRFHEKYPEAAVSH